MSCELSFGLRAPASEVFTLTGVDGLTIDAITNVSFQCGTSLTELNIPGTVTRVPPTAVPEPGSMALAGLGCRELALQLRRNGEAAGNQPIKALRPMRGRTRAGHPAHKMKRVSSL
jgi:hypothetical protein